MFRYGSQISQSQKKEHEKNLYVCKIIINQINLIRLATILKKLTVFMCEITIYLNIDTQLSKLICTSDT